MARQLREIPDSQEFDDVEALPGWTVTIAMGYTAGGGRAIHSLSIKPRYELHATDDRELMRGVIALVGRRVPGEGVTAKLLRRLSFRTLVGDEWAARVLDADSFSPPPRTRRESRATGARRGRPLVYSIAWYTRLAREYEALYARGVPAIRKELARKFNVKETQIRDAICRMRKEPLSLLGPTSQGIARP